MWPPGPWPGPRELWWVGDNSTRLGVQGLGSDPGSAADQLREAGLGLRGLSLSLLACGEELRAPRCQLTGLCGSGLGVGPGSGLSDDQGWGSLRDRRGLSLRRASTCVCDRGQDSGWDQGSFTGGGQ